MASYLRSLRSGNAPVDRFLQEDTTALCLDARRDFRLFVGRAGCGVCHLKPLFTDHQFHNTGVSWGSSDLGRYEVTGREEDRGAFKTPSLRHLSMTAPYMHDGSLATLDEVLDHYEAGETPNPYLDPELGPVVLSPAARQLIAFLESMTGELPAVAAAPGLTDPSHGVGTLNFGAPALQRVLLADAGPRPPVVAARDRRSATARRTR